MSHEVPETEQQGGMKSPHEISPDQLKAARHLGKRGKVDASGNVITEGDIRMNKDIENRVH